MSGYSLLFVLLLDILAVEPMETMRPAKTPSGSFGAFMEWYDL